MIQHAGSLKNCKYADIRLGIRETKHANAEDGKAKGMGEDASISFGIRVLAGEMSAWGYYGQSLGKGEFLIEPGSDRDASPQQGGATEPRRDDSDIQGILVSARPDADPRAVSERCPHASSEDAPDLAC